MIKKIMIKKKGNNFLKKNGILNSKSRPENSESEV